MNKIILFLSVIIGFTAVSLAASCGVDSAGYHFDLSTIPSTSLVVEEEEAKYKFNFCDKIGEPSCDNENGMFCSYTKDNEFKKVLALRKNNYDVKYEEGIELLQITYTNAQDEGKKITAKFQIYCNDVNTESSVEHFSTDSIYEILIISPAGCPTGKSSSGGLSGGWIFIIIVLIALFLWLIVGTIVNILLFKANKGVSAIIGINLVTALFTNALDGVKFLISKITNRKGSLSSTSGPATDYSTY